MTDDELKGLIGSNAKAIEALTNSFNEFKTEAERDRKQWMVERTAFYDTMTQMQRQFLDYQRQFLDLQRQIQDNQHRIDDKNADIRELTIENQRILRYLENLVNRSEPHE